jgi:hypothetical protein
MARKASRRKKTFSQKIVGVATKGMPQPVKKMLGARWIAALIVIAVPVLFVTGVLTLDWEGGRPKVSINRQKAAEVKQELSQDVQALRSQRQGLSR